MPAPIPSVTNKESQTTQNGEFDGYTETNNMIIKNAANEIYPAKNIVI